MIDNRKFLEIIWVFYFKSKAISGALVFHDQVHRDQDSCYLYNSCSSSQHRVALDLGVWVVEVRVDVILAVTILEDIMVMN